MFHLPPSSSSQTNLNLMATENSVYEEDLLCPQCEGIFSFAVQLKCGHNICRACLKQFWVWKGSRICPVCGAPSAAKPIMNLSLNRASDKYRAGLNICAQHNEKLKIFCQNDEEPICVVCQISKRHKVHDCSPVEEAAQQKKGEISSQVNNLKKKLQILHKKRTNWEQIKTYIQTHVTENEAAIKAKFDTLHRFLNLEEHKRLNEINQEAKTKTEVMSKKLETIEKQITDLSTSISDLEKRLKKPDLPFLMEYKDTKAIAKCDVQEPECVQNVLINSAHHLGLLEYETWKSMVKLVKRVPVILDPNTAHYNLSISPDLSSVQWGNQKVLPDNPERCTIQTCVLGAAGFTSGKHRWTTAVDQAKNWSIGVALESFNRKKHVSLKPAEGIWLISLSNGDSLFVEGIPRIKLPMKKKPEMITVELDYDKGKVVFINASDLSTIHTFKGKFKERIFPYFSLGMPENEWIQSTLTICPAKLDVVVE